MNNKLFALFGQNILYLRKSAQQLKYSGYETTRKKNNVAIKTHFKGYREMPK